MMREFEWERAVTGSDARTAVTTLLGHNPACVRAVVDWKVRPSGVVLVTSARWLSGYDVEVWLGVWSEPPERRVEGLSTIDRYRFAGELLIDVRRADVMNARVTR